ncbi:hypothetical protein ABT090_33520 [Streptomyces asoensis]|uniref:hypothetical protein n=1 Tax=Streptomyces asoensis TaxID=249586 RepID=UPI0033236065
MTTLLAGLLTVLGLGFSAGTAEAADSCMSAIPTYRLATSGFPVPKRQLTRYVDWDPKNQEQVFNTEKSASIPRLQNVFSGGGTRLFMSSKGVGYPYYDILQSFRDKSETGGSLLTPEYTYQQRSGQNWEKYTRIWADAQGRVVNFDESGNLNVYVEQFPDGTPASARMSRLAQSLASTPAVTELGKSQVVWPAGTKVYGLLNGIIRSWDYSAALNTITLGPTAQGTVEAAGLSDAVSAWSPAPGTVYTQTAAGDVKKYAGSPLQLVNSDVATGLTGSMFAGAASCLSDAAEPQGYFGQKVDDTGLPEVSGVPDPDPAPSLPDVISGKFTLGDGSPAAGLDVVIEADVPVSAEGTDFPDLGTARTAADGTWSLTLPENLPPAVQQAAETNGGALNVTATTMAVTTSGVQMVGVDHRTAAPEETDTGQRTSFASAASSTSAHSIELIPILDSSDSQNNLPEPTEDQKNSTYAAQVDKETVYSDTEDPQWQSDRGTLAAGYNPYIINGVNVSSQQVTPYASGTCSWTTWPSGSPTYSYTTVGEAHAYTDAKASFDYESKVSSTVDVAISYGSSWKISGERSVANSSGALSGFPAKGPYWAKQWRIPLEYQKQKRVYMCGGVQKGSQYRIVPIRYTIPAGWYAGTYGKDVRQLDGPTRYAASNPEYRSKVAAGAYVGVSRGKSVKWKGAATPFGISLGGSIQYDSNHVQKVIAGTKSGVVHRVWGLYDKVSGRPGVIYSY